MMNGYKLTTILFIILILSGVVAAVVVNIDGSGISGVTNQSVNFYSGNYNNLTNVPTNFPNTSLGNYYLNSNPYSFYNSSTVPAYLLISTYGSNFPNSTVANNLANWNATNNTAVLEGLQDLFNFFNSTDGLKVNKTDLNSTVNFHSGNASNITSGILSVAHGGTGSSVLESVYKEEFTGNSVALNFTTEHPIIVNSTQIFINGLVQPSGVGRAYTEGTQSINLTSVLENNYKLEIIYSSTG